jgi:hypothetical protein
MLFKDVSGLIELNTDESIKPELLERFLISY